uniref:Carnitine O-acetyltransferase-like n=1 Tax=Hirondellea gigas TaxID=1518452 RepID=A0A2P2HYR7_9CRUS
MLFTTSYIARKGLCQVLRSSSSCGWISSGSSPACTAPSAARREHYNSISATHATFGARRYHYNISNWMSNTRMDKYTKESCGSLHPRNSTKMPLMSAGSSPYSSFMAQKDTLPRLPVPDLHATMHKFLKSARPLVTAEEYAVTENLVNNFIQPGGVGETLQQLLVERAARLDNWLSDWWVDTAYFRYRMPVVVWSSPGLVFPLVEFKNDTEQLQYAAKLIAGAVDYKDQIDNDRIPIEMMGGKEVDMSQYFKIFSTCRIPGLTKDSVCHHSQDPDTPKHIVVMHRNHFFRVDVYGKAGKLLNPEQLVSQLQDIVRRSTRDAAPVGILTSQNRNVWGQAYKILMKADKRNADHLQTINRALFVVCLDNVVTPSTGNPMTDAALQCVHGGGSKGNSANRWFDKTIQFIIGRSGRVGLTYEHSPAEGPPIANLMDHIVDYIENVKHKKLLAAVELSRPQRLQFTVPSELDAEMHRAGDVLDSLVEDLEMTCFIFESFGKNFIKSQKMSPDSFIQMAIQLAFFRIHKEPGAQYESGSTRQFLYGRTECIRSCSYESVNFCTAMLDPSYTPKQRLDTLLAAMQSHKSYVQQALKGHGVDRHLLGLKLAAIEAGMDVPPIFMDVSYNRSSHMRLSTSQVPAKCEAFMCYGPLVPDGYGCCYNPRSDSIVFGTSALNSSPETSSATFRDALETSLRDMRDMLLTTPKAKL